MRAVVSGRSHSRPPTGWVATPNTRSSLHSNSNSNPNPKFKFPSWNQRKSPPFFASSSSTRFLVSASSSSSSSSSPEIVQTDFSVATGTLLEAGDPVCTNPNPASDGLSLGDVALSENQITSDPSCPVPDFTSSAKEITLICPLPLLPENSSCSSAIMSERNGKKVLEFRPLLIYVPGMDCTGQCIRSQIPFLYNEGYDIRCVYIPSNDRSPWKILVTKLSKLIEKEALIEEAMEEGEMKGNEEENASMEDVAEFSNGSFTRNREESSKKYRHVTILAESFGACLSLRLALQSPNLISRLVLVNPATNFRMNNPVISFCISTGLLEKFPMPLYEFAQDIALPLLIKRNKVNKSKENLISPIDYVSASCANFRLSLLNDESGLEEHRISSIDIPTLLVASAKDRILPSVSETSRLKNLLKNVQRYILPESGHTIFLEDDTDISRILRKNSFEPPPPETLFIKQKQNLKRKESVDDALIDEFCSFVEPWRILTSPVVFGDENLPNPNSIPKRPILFVGNHTVYGLYDTPLLIQQLYMRGFKVKGLALPAHWLTITGGIMERYGNVKASPFAAYRLLKEGENVLLFPGGSREVCKRKGEEYKLFWKEKVDFVRMAEKLNAIIVPFSAIGAEEAFKIVFDANDLKNSIFGEPLSSLFSNYGLSISDNFQPISAIPGTDIPSLLPIPNLEKVYFYFSEPIDPKNFVPKDENLKWEELYALAKSKVENGIEYLKSEREKDEERKFPDRLVAKFFRLLPEFTPRKNMNT